MPELHANVYRPPVAAAARALLGTGLRPVSVAGRAITVLSVTGDDLRLAVLVRGPGGRIRLHRLHSTRCSAIAERRQTRVELSDGEQFVLAGTLPHGLRRGLPLELGQHPMALTARALGMAGTPVLTVSRRG